MLKLSKAFSYRVLLIAVVLVSGFSILLGVNFNTLKSIINFQQSQISSYEQLLSVQAASGLLDNSDLISSLKNINSGRSTLSDFITQDDSKYLIVNEENFVYENRYLLFSIEVPKGWIIEETMYYPSPKTDPTTKHLGSSSSIFYNENGRFLFAANPSYGGREFCDSFNGLDINGLVMEIKTEKLKTKSREIELLSCYYLGSFDSLLSINQTNNEWEGIEFEGNPPVEEIPRIKSALETLKLD